MSDLIQRLTQTNQFHENADVTTKEVVDALAKQEDEIERHLMEVDASRDRIEDLEEELTKLKAQSTKDAAELEELKIQGAKLSEAVYLLSGGNVTLIKERDSLKAQAAKDAADAGRRVAVITLYHGAGLAAANYIDQLGGVSKHYRVTLEAMKESQQ